MKTTAGRTWSTSQDRSTPRGNDTDRNERRIDALLVLGLAFALLAWFLWPFVVRGARFPLGPDAPVYLWWTRLVGVDGLSAVDRPGVPALTLVLQGTLGLSVVQATAAIEVAHGITIGVASAALVRRSTSAWGAALAGLLAGTFAVHLAAGYVATLITATTMMAAATLLDDPRLRAALLAALVLAGGGLAHPDFLLLCGAILLIAAAMAWRAERAEAIRIAGAAVGSAVLLGIGLFAVRPGAPALDVDTSKDAFLRRAGLTSELRSAYFDRFVHRWTRYVQWVSVPLAIAGFGAGRANPGRILRAWFLLTLVGVAVALATGWLPADRFITFGFAVPILAALGLMRVWRGLRDRPVLAYGLIGALAFLMVAGSAIAWNRQEPFMTEQEVRSASLPSGIVPALPGPVLAFLVNQPDNSVTFLATRAANVIRASVPPTRIRQVVVVVPPASGVPASVQRTALERLTAADLAEAERRSQRGTETFVLTPFDPIDRPAGAYTLVDPSRLPRESGAIDPLEPASVWEIVWASIVAFALLWVVGFGWARIGLEDPVRAAAISPAVGAAALILVAVGLDAIGVSLGSTGGAVAASVLAGGGGYLVGLVLQRRARTHPAPQVEEQPAE